MNQHIGSNFDDFLREEGIFAEVEAAAIKKVIACMITEAMAEAHINKSEMARRMNTSHSINCLILKHNKTLIPTRRFLAQFFVKKLQTKNFKQKTSNKKLQTKNFKRATI